MRIRLYFLRSTGLMAVLICLSACAVKGSEVLDMAPTHPSAIAAQAPVRLKAPVLSFNDSGLSVTDGITDNGLWDVASEIDWEFSLDRGLTWTRGVGSSFEVTSDGAKVIWVRSRDDAGNTSEIVRVNCVLDTMAPAALGVVAQAQGWTNSLKFSGFEPGARWEYSLDEQRSWAAGQ